jgi:hypothetical protein
MKCLKKNLFRNDITEFYRHIRDDNFFSLFFQYFFINFFILFIKYISMCIFAISLMRWLIVKVNNVPNQFTRLSSRWRIDFIAQINRPVIDYAIFNHDTTSYNHNSARHQIYLYMYLYARSNFQELFYISPYRHYIRRKYFIYNIFFISRDTG